MGDIDPEDGFARAERYFGGVARRADAGASAMPMPLPPLMGVPRASLTEPRARRTPSTARGGCPARGTRAYDAARSRSTSWGAARPRGCYRPPRPRRPDRVGSAGASAIGLIGGTSLGFAFARALDDTALDTLEDAHRRRTARDSPTRVRRTTSWQRTRVQFEREWLGQLARFESRADLFGSLRHAPRRPDARQPPDRRVLLDHRRRDPGRRPRLAAARASGRARLPTAAARWEESHER